MSSGFQNIVINPLERAVSVDINRLQSLSAADVAELFRFLLDVSNGTDDLDAAAVQTSHDTTENPLRAEVINGLLVKPQIATLNLLVDPGVAFVLDPDSPALPDDSEYKYIRDPGIASTGVLSMTTNSSGSTRIDVIECARVASPGYSIIETDNRDIFNPTTGLFTPTTVNKRTAGRLQYRVRLGTPGGGFPGTASGWLPLAVALVPTGTTSNDTVDFWDVRPMLNDREFSLSATSRAFPGIDRNISNAQNSAGNLVMAGNIEARAGGRRLGGIVRRGTPGTDADNLLLGPTDKSNWENGLSALTGSAFYYLYLLTPFGLPRWARYTDASSSVRKPRSPRGIFVLSTFPPGPDNVPQGAVSLPAAFGGGSTTAGLCVASLRANTGGTALLSLHSVAHKQHMLDDITSQAANSFSTSTASWTMTAGTEYPNNARMLHVQINLTSTSGVIAPYYSNYEVNVKDAGGNIIFTESLGSRVFNGGSLTGYVDVTSLWIPVPQLYPAASANFTITVDYSVTGSGASITAASLDVDGWELW